MQKLNSSTGVGLAGVARSSFRGSEVGCESSMNFCSVAHPSKTAGIFRAYELRVSEVYERKRNSLFSGRDSRCGWCRSSGGRRGVCRGRLNLTVVAEATDNFDRDNKNSAQLYGQIERVIVDTAKRTQGTYGNAGRWQEIEGVWVLRPSKNEPRAVIHFVGGVFVGATPQLTYRLFLERLSERGFLIVATPYASGFDHLHIADEVQFKFDRCIRVMRDELVGSLPIFGVGHSLGALTLLLTGARYAVQRAGNVLMSFNNKEAYKAIPLFSPVIVPMAQNFAPILAQLSASPTIRLGAEMAMKQLQSLSPPIVKQILPLVEQLPPLYYDLASGKDRFVPTPDETFRLIKSYYGVGRNLLVKFKDDLIDETPALARALGSDSVVSSFLDLSLRTLPGDHARPLQQYLPEFPPGMIDAVTRGGEMLANLAVGTPFADVAKGMGQSFGYDSSTMRMRQQVIQDIEQLVDELAGWMHDSIQ